MIYQVYVRSFLDSTGDGVGDLAGVRAGLPYLRKLGVDGIWLSPFYPSPQHDHGYDVADYRDVDPLFGDLAEFDLLVALARKPRQVFTREVLLEQVWGYRHAADTRLVNVHVQRLRSKVERDPETPEVVLTVRGVGYKAGPA